MEGYNLQGKGGKGTIYRGGGGGGKFLLAGYENVTIEVTEGEGCDLAWNSKQSKCMI